MPRLARSRHHQRDVVEGASAIAASRARCRGPARSSWSFDTLATQVFTLTSLYRYEEAELSALIMVVVSLAPVLLLHGVIVAGRPGSLTSSRRAASAKGVAETEGLLISQ